MSRLLSFVLCFSLLSTCFAADEPDLILHNGKIVTVDKDFSIAQAIAIRGERIVAVGKNDDVLKTKGEQTRVVDLAEPRFRFLNTLLSISEASLYAQLVDRLDAGELMTQASGPMGYDELYWEVTRAIDKVHATGALKSEIISNPDRFCSLDDATATTLLDQRVAGKRLLLITNSEWPYTRDMKSRFSATVRSSQSEKRWVM